LVGLDLGQMQDWSALAVVEQHQRISPAPYSNLPASYDIRHLDRWRIPYPEVVTRVSALLWDLHRAHTVREFAHRAGYRSDIEPTIRLAIDGTGVGVAVVDLFREADLPGNMTAIVITGGDAISKDGDVTRVPKRDLASVIQVLLQSKRLRIADGLPLASTLQQELLNFRVKISLSGHDSYGAGADWRQANHDDLVLAAAMALWLGEHEGSGRFEAVSDEVADVLGNMGL
jgi:hypothetical protein